MATTQLPADALAKLREPFPAHQISKLPKESRKQIDERKNGQNAINNCPVCGGWHHKNAVHLDYVGHAALTDRLLDVDPAWSWDPVAFGQDGLPALDRNGGLWIRLTICGVTRLGYGHADNKQGGDAIKEAIGDALRNAAMRFGAALDLWHKGDLHVDEDAADDAPKAPKAQPQRAQRPDPHDVPPAAKPVDRTADAVPVPEGDDAGDWEAWRKVVAKKIAAASSAVDVGKIRSANKQGLECCDQILPDTSEKIEAFVTERLEKIAGDDFPGDRQASVAGRRGDHQRAAA